MKLAELPNLSGKRSYLESPNNFRHWLDRTLKSDSIDKTRSLLYYGFQPLFDVLAEQRVEGDARKLALALLKKVVKFNADYVSGYYTGGKLPDVQQLEELTPQVDALDEAKVRYQTKTRNIGLYDGDGRDLCTPNHVQQFLVALDGAVEQNVLPAPDYIVGCACGASEIVMPIAQIFDVPLGFIRRSKRRGDTTPLVITEHVATIKRHAKDKIVYVLEDFVCTGQSIHSVMAKVEGYGATRVIGLSIARNHEDCLTSKLHIIHTFPGRHGSYAYQTKS
jgi:adenine/guanine phosphoribosyltransferase-like PRPP-binding protein